ncbi:sodium/hydrogen exchanger 2-like [Rosa rugosa]|uniref:sodium/hydrogen exchanger 2-like n=1 Tax=Rosa rugosa TaxID=74645 RepID=UPI002B409ADC|nr:sodium/hydrogen exchanger 2-like [Rosa rugosa]XP_062015827.1 sodium/hydrogen exchanger 2-like [Rosa rugosa]XP_062015828.1 sodium/hydrogen exchanger 2-like [Rosa rugosa]
MVKIIKAGLISAYIIKTLYFRRHSTDGEVALMMLMAYLSYMLAESCHKHGVMLILYSISEFSKLYASTGSMIAWPIKYIKVN